MLPYISLLPGDPAPDFKQRSFSNANYVFNSAAGRYIVLCFFGSASDPKGRAAIDLALSHKGLFNDDKASFFGVSMDPKDETERRVADHYPGYRYFWDFDGRVSKLYGAIPSDCDPSAGQVPVRRKWVVLDPTMRVMKVFPIEAEVMTYLESLPPPSRFAGFELQAPVLVLPNVFEPDFCEHLISLYETHGGEESGFMREVNGKTVLVNDHGHKRRRDYLLADPKVIEATQARFYRRVVPEIAKVHQFAVTRMERYIVSCYAAEDAAHFAPHRDNTTKGTAHRRFAVSVNLNDDFDGGEVSFPEYGPRSFKAPTGGAVVFSCSLLHAVSQVTRGRRYAFLPFLYDDAAAKIREENNQFIDGGGNYKVSTPPIGLDLPLGQKIPT